MKPLQEHYFLPCVIATGGVGSVLFAALIHDDIRKAMDAHIILPALQGFAALGMFATVVGLTWLALGLLARVGAAFKAGLKGRSA